MKKAEEPTECLKEGRVCIINITLVYKKNINNKMVTIEGNECESQVSHQVANVEERFQKDLRVSFLLVYEKYKVVEEQ